MSDYQAAFFIVPVRIMNLPNITISFLRIYETIYQFINHQKPCFLSNEMIKERTGITSNSTISEAYKYFELHGELKRVMKDGKRYFVQPSRHIVVENDSSVDKPLATARGGVSPEREGGLATARHNTKNINTKNINRDFCSSNDKKINNDKEKIKPIFSNVERQSNSYNPNGPIRADTMAPIMLEALKRANEKEDKG